MEVVPRFSPSGENRFYLSNKEELVIMDISEVRFASRFDQVTGSAIREIFKVIAQPGMVSFAGGK